MSTMLHRLHAWSKEEPHVVAQRFKKDGKWQDYTTVEYCNRVFWMACFLQNRGMASKDIGAVFSYNSPQWVHLDLGIQLLGAKSAGIYPNSSAGDLSYVLSHSECKVVGIQNRDYFDRVQQADAKLLEQVEVFIVLQGDASFSEKAVSYDDAIAEGKKFCRW